MTLNDDIKCAAKSKNVCLWEIANALGIADTSMSRKLRYELTTDEKARIYTIIDMIAAQHAAQAAATAVK